jgi:hypothetical protein
MRNVYFEANSTHFNGKMLWTINLKISPCLSRTLYFEKSTDRDECLQMLKLNQRDQLASNEDFKNFYIDKSRDLGEGTFGKVSLYECKSTQRLVAVKTIKKDKTNVEELFEQISEYFLVKNLDHHYISKTRCLFEDENNFFIVMDYINGSTLVEFVYGK